MLSGSGPQRLFFLSLRFGQYSVNKVAAAQYPGIGADSCTLAPHRHNPGPVSKTPDETIANQFGTSAQCDSFLYKKIQGSKNKLF